MVEWETQQLLFSSRIRIPMCTQNLMALHPISARRVCAFCGLLFVLVSCQYAFAGGLAPTPISRSPKLPTSSSLVLTVDNSVQPGAIAPFIIGNWISQLMNKLETWLTNRTHMIQFCAIGMVLALFIIWWRKT